jgi:hypothetical protein
LAIFAVVGLSRWGGPRPDGSPGVGWLVAAAVGTVVVGLVAGPFAFPVFVLAALVLVVVARRYWAHVPATSSVRGR